MSRRRLFSRISGVTNIGTARLRGYQLRFHKLSQKDGTGKCDAFRTDNQHDYVYGVVYCLSPEKKYLLDSIEGVGVGYREEKVQVTMETGEQKEASMYVAITIQSSLKPYNWYKEHVLHGARENHLPEDYIEIIEKKAVIEDKNTYRHLQEMSIYTIDSTASKN